MLEVLTAESILALTTVLGSLLALACSWWAVFSTRERPKTVDLEPFLRDAPMHRLHNVLPPK